MTEPTITCPNCHTEIKLTESLAAPLLESTRRQYEQLIAQKESEVSTRESAVREKQAALAKAQESIDEHVASRLKSERAGIAAAEAKKAREALADDIAQREVPFRRQQHAFSIQRRRDPRRSSHHSCVPRPCATHRHRHHRADGPALTGRAGH